MSPGAPTTSLLPPPTTRSASSSLSLSSERLYLVRLPDSRPLYLLTAAAALVPDHMAGATMDAFTKEIQNCANHLMTCVEEVAVSHRADKGIPQSERFSLWHTSSAFTNLCSLADAAPSKVAARPQTPPASPPLVTARITRSMAAANATKPGTPQQSAADEQSVRNTRKELRKLSLEPVPSKSKEQPADSNSDDDTAPPAKTVQAETKPASAKKRAADSSSDDGVAPSAKIAKAEIKQAPTKTGQPPHAPAPKTLTPCPGARGGRHAAPSRRNV